MYFENNIHLLGLWGVLFYTNLQYYIEFIMIITHGFSYKFCCGGSTIHSTYFKPANGIDVTSSLV